MVLKNIDVLKVLLERELFLKYKGTLLGFFWFLLNPALSIAVYYLVFAVILKIGKEDYIQYLISGVLIWNFISSSILLLSNSFISYSNFLKKIPINSVIIPVAVLSANAIPYLILNFVAKVVMEFSLVEMIYLFVMFILISLQLFFLGTSLGVLNSFVKDIGYVLSFLLNLLFYLSPVVYYLELVPADLRHLFFFNPLAIDVILWHEVFLGRGINPGYFLVFIVHTLFSSLVFLFLFKKLGKYLPEVL